MPLRRFFDAEEFGHVRFVGEAGFFTAAQGIEGFVAFFGGFPGFFAGGAAGVVQDFEGVRGEHLVDGFDPEGKGQVHPALHAQFGGFCRNWVPRTPRTRNPTAKIISRA